MDLLRIFLFTIAVLIAGCGQSPIFTKEEIAYIESATVIWAVDDNYHPLVEFNNSDPIGISVDYLRLISEKSGLRFVPYGTSCLVTECLLMIRDDKVDMTTSIRPSMQRSKYVNFTRPYLFVGTLMIKSTNNPMTIGISRGSNIKDFLIRQNPLAKIVEYDSDSLAYSALLNAEVGAIVSDEISIHSLQLRDESRNNFDTVTVPHDYPLSFALSKNNVILKSILDKAITLITEKEHQRILNKWKLK